MVYMAVCSFIQISIYIVCDQTNNDQIRIIVYNIVSMGSHSTKEKALLSFNPDEYLIVPLKSYTKIKDPYYGSNFKILMSKTNSHCQLQKYDLIFNSNDDFLQYQESLLWRNSSHYIVPVRYLHESKYQGYCSSAYHSFLLVERIPIRLTQINDISFEEGLYIINASMEGFLSLYQKFGYFQIQLDLVCFNKEGQVKTWINRNLSQIYPENTSSQKRNNPITFLYNYLKKLETLIDFQGHRTFTQYLLQSKLENDNIKEVFKNYVKSIKQILPRYLQSIKILCSDKMVKSRHMKNSIKTNQPQSNRTFVNQKPVNLNFDKSILNMTIKTPQRQSFTQKCQPERERERYNYSMSFVIPSTTTYTQYQTRRPNIHFQYPVRKSLDHIPYLQKREVLRQDNKRKSMEIERKTVENQMIKKNSLQIYDAGQNKADIDPEIAEDLYYIYGKH